MAGADLVEVLVEEVGHQEALLVEALVVVEGLLLLKINISILAFLSCLF